MNPNKAGVSINKCMEELAKSTLILADRIDKIRDHFNLYMELNPALPNHCKDFLHLIAETTPEIKAKYKVGDRVMYSTDSSGFEFIVSEIHITLDGVFYNEEYLKQDNVHRILEG